MCIRDRIWRGMEENAFGSRGELKRSVMIGDSAPVPIESLRVETIGTVGSSRPIYFHVEAARPGTVFEMDLALGREGIGPGEMTAALHRRSELMLELEMARFGGQRWMRREIERLAELNEIDSPLLRLGWGQGFLGVTVAAALAADRPDALEKLRLLLSRSFGQYRRTKRDNFPKTRRLALDARGRPKHPLGWAKVRICRYTSSSPTT